MSVLSPFANVMIREMQRIYSHPRHAIAALLAIIFAYVFFLSFMQDGQPQRLPIAIVDEDGTFLSRRLCHEINATQGVEVAAVYNNHSEARKAMQRQDIYAFLEIPSGTYNEVLSFKAPHISLYANNAYLLSGTLSYKSLMTICNLASGAVQREVLRKKGYDEQKIMALIMPIEIDAHLIGNPMANYQSYLLTTILPGILGLICLLITVYVIGLEFREGSAREWLSQADDNMAVALAGKLCPYAIAFLLMQMIGNMVLFGLFHFTLEGSFLTLALGSLIFVLSMMAFGIFAMGLLLDLRNAVCISAFYGILGFSLSGFTYPVSGMSPALQALSIIFPLRQNYLIYINEAVLGLPLSASLPHFGILFLFLLLPLFANRRLKQSILSNETSE